MFRSAHSLKGLSAMLGLTDINHLTHKIENVFDAARHGPVEHHPRRDRADVHGARSTDRHGRPAEGARRRAGGLRRRAGGDPPGAPERPARKKADDAGRRGARPGRPMRGVPETRVATTRQGAPQHADPFEGITDEDDIPDNYLSMFVDEAEASLDALAERTAGPRRRRNGGELKSLLGTAHKIKGSAASVGLNRAAKLAHLMEDLLENLVDLRAARSRPQMTDLLLQVHRSACSSTSTDLTDAGTDHGIPGCSGPVMADAVCWTDPRRGRRVDDPRHGRTVPRRVDLPARSGHGRAEGPTDLREARQAGRRARLPAAAGELDAHRPSGLLPLPSDDGPIRRDDCRRSCDVGGVLRGQRRTAGRSAGKPTTGAQQTGAESCEADPAGRSRHNGAARAASRPQPRPRRDAERSARTSAAPARDPRPAAQRPRRPCGSTPTGSIN